VIKVTKDGRTIRTGKDYTDFRSVLWHQQMGTCAECRIDTSLTADIESDYSFHVHHIGGRGLGGSKRDDVSGKCVGLCGLHHREEHQ
jgi:hypothetical protein